MPPESLPPTPPPGSPWTQEQWEAIRARDQQLLVAAAAGAGKTATLVERIIRRLHDPVAPVEIDRLLVVTFTEAAAAEMRGRIAAALQRSLAQDPGNPHLRRQMALLERATISTLHSFCLGLLRQHFHQLNLDPAFKVMGDHEAQLLKEEVLDQVFEEAYGADDPGPFLALLDRYGGLLGDEALRALVLDLHEFARTTPWPEAWLERTAARFDLPPGADGDVLREWAREWTAPLLQEAALRLSEAAARLEAALAAARSPGGPAAYAETLAEDLAAVLALRDRAAAGDWDGLAAGLGGLSWGKLKPVRSGSCDPDLQDEVKRLRDEVRNMVKALQADGALARPLREHAEELRALGPHVRTLVELVRRFDAAFTAAKLENGQVDFADLERYALRLLMDPGAPPGELRPSPVARELRRRFAEVLVDEYQDINPVQDAILTLVSRDGGEEGPPNLFMVGDVKQSIYRFRLAEPRLFLGKYRSFPPAPGGPARRIDLRANFRSRPAVVSAVNFLFRQVMTPGVGELAYDQAAELVPGARYPEPPPGAPAGEAPVEVWILERPAAQGQPAGGGTPAGNPPSGAEEGVSGPEAGGPGAPAEGADTGTAGEEAREAEEDPGYLTDVEREARLAARWLRQLRARGLMVWDKDVEGGRYRPFSWRDAVILLRSTRTVAQKVLEVLQDEGIPAHADAGTGYFEALEVQTVLALLQVIDNPRQDIPLAAVLRAPFAGLGLTPEDLARIRLCHRQGSFYDAVVRAAALARGKAEDDSPVPPELVRRLAAFLRRLDRWRTLARQEPLSQLLWQLYEETGYLYYVAGLPGGAQRRANLLALYDRARQFDQFARQGLFRFLRFVDNLRDRGEDVGPAPALSDHADVVRVMSIHKSKGLEFPVVLVLGLGRQFNTQDERATVLRHRDLGLGPAVVDPDLRCQYPSLAHRAIAWRLHREMLAEEMRVLYVALTRARERLVLVGSCRDLAQTAAGWARSLEKPDWPLPDAILARARSYLDWIGPALIRHRDGAPLRELAGVAGAEDAGPVWSDPSRWTIRLVTGARDQDAGTTATTDGAAGAGEEVAAAGEVAGGPEADLPWEQILAGAPLPEPPAPTPQREALAARLAWQYPHQGLTRIPAKETVTGVKHLFAPGAPGAAEVAAAGGTGTASEMAAAGAAGSAAGADAADTMAGATPEVVPEDTAPVLADEGIALAGTEGEAGDPEGEAERLEGPVPPEYRLQPMARPRFLQEHRSLTPAERGTVTHLFLQHLRLELPLDLDALAAERDRLVRREILTPEQAEAIDLEAVAAFFRHPLGQRLLASPNRVRREVAFTYSLPARALDPTLPPGPEGEEPVLLQGMIDCLLDEPDGLVLIDFKTDRLRPDQVPQAVARYSGQLILYARAIGEIWRRPVREAWLYFMGPGRAEPVPIGE